MERRKKDHYEDITFHKIYDFVKGLLEILAIIWVVCGVLIWFAWDLVYKENVQHNESAIEFNARPLAERTIIADYLENDGFDETYSIPLTEVGLTGLEATWNWTLIVLCCTVVILSAVTFLSYCSEKDKKYYLADLPLSKPYGWLLLFSMFIAWPVLLIALLHMLYLENSNLHNTIVEKRQKIVEERKRVKMMAKRELRQEEIERAQHCGSFSPQAKRQYFRYRHAGYKKALDHQKDELNQLISEHQNQLRSLSEKLQAEQRQLGEAKARLASLENCSPMPQDESIAEEWRHLTEMRGVSRISFEQKNKEIRFLCILVKVRVPYKGVLYDFGDYEIKIRPKEFSCREVRSGVKAHAEVTAPHYGNRGGFCFGSRRDDISNFVQHARMLEAITLMIDCLHSVNPGNEKYIPDCFRTVKSIETAKRRLARRQ